MSDQPEISSARDADEKRKASQRRRARESYQRRKNDPEFVAARKGWNKAARERNPDKYAAHLEKWREENKEKLTAQRKRWKQENADLAKSQLADWRAKNPERNKSNKKAQYAKKRESIKAARAAYYEAHREELDALAAERKEKAREKARVAYKISRTKRVAAGIRYKRPFNPYTILRTRLHNRMRTLVRCGSMETKPSTLAFIGCTGRELRQHIEAQFKAGMAWDNCKLWHIDHIRPCNTFDLNDPAQQAICFHYTNLRPLWATENLRRPKDGSDIKQHPIPAGIALDIAAGKIADDHGIRA